MKIHFLLAVMVVALVACSKDDASKNQVEVPKVAEQQVATAADAPIKDVCEEQQWTVIFKCTIKKQPLTYCQHVENDTRIIEMNAKVNNIEIAAQANDSEKNSPIKIQSVFDKPVSFDTIYFEDNQSTFALTRCNGMCVQAPWLTVYKGNNKTLVAQCDEDSVTVDTIDSQYKTDKKGRIVKNGLYQEKKSPLNFDAPN